MIQFVMTEHAENVCAAREIEHWWIERVLSSPSAVERDRIDPDLRHVWAPIAERDGRTLRVVYDETVVPVRIVTAFFDRRLGRIG